MISCEIYIIVMLLTIKTDYIIYFSNCMYLFLLIMFYVYNYVVSLHATNIYVKTDSFAERRYSFPLRRPPLPSVICDEQRLALRRHPSGALLVSHSRMSFDS